MKDAVNILNGPAFLVSDENRDIEAGAEQPEGLFFRDMRQLSRWRLSVNQVQQEAHSTHTVECDFTQFAIVPPTSAIYQNPTLTFVGRRWIGDGFVDKPAIFNHSNGRQVIDIQLEVAAACADLFEVKDALPNRGEYYRRMNERPVLGYRREDAVRETIINATASRNEIEESPFVLDVVLNVNGYNPTETDNRVTEQPGLPTYKSDSEPNDGARSRCRNRKGDLRRGEKYRCEPPRP